MNIQFPDKLLILFTRKSFQVGMMFLPAGLCYGAAGLLQTGNSQMAVVFPLLSLISFGISGFFLAKGIHTSARIIRVLSNFRIAQARLNETPQPRDEFDALPKYTIDLSYRQNQREYAKSFFTTEPDRYNREEPVLVCNTRPDEFLMVKLLPKEIARKAVRQEG